MSNGIARSASATVPCWRNTLARKRICSRHENEKSISLLAVEAVAQLAVEQAEHEALDVRRRRAAGSSSGVSLPSMRSSGGAPAVRWRSVALCSASTVRYCSMPEKSTGAVVMVGHSRRAWAAGSRARARWRKIWVGSTQFRRKGASGLPKSGERLGTLHSLLRDSGRIGSAPRGAGSTRKPIPVLKHLQSRRGDRTDVGAGLHPRGAARRHRHPRHPRRGGGVRRRRHRRRTPRSRRASAERSTVEAAVEAYKSPDRATTRRSVGAISIDDRLTTTPTFLRHAPQYWDGQRRRRCTRQRRPGDATRRRPTRRLRS